MTHFRHIIIAHTAVVAFLFAGCHHDSATMQELSRIDSMIYHQQAAVALPVLQKMDTKGFNREEKAYYSLLLTQARYKNYINDTTDGVINFAVDYYKNSGDHEKHTRSLLYQGCVYEVMGDAEKAISSYKRTEDVADENDLGNKAYAKLRLASLYSKNSYYTELKINKYKEALELYRQLDNKHYQTVCLTEIGNLYRNDTICLDSARHYSDQAIKLAEAGGENWFQFQNLYLRAEQYCLLTKDYGKAKVDILKALQAGKGVIDHPRAHYIAAEVYLNLGQRDSAVYYLNQAQTSKEIPKTVRDSVMYYHLLSEIAKRDKNWDQYTANYEKAHNMADSVLMANVNKNYLEIEKKYDHQIAVLNQVKNESHLRGILLLAAILALALMALVFLVWRYRNQLKMRQNEVDMLKADLKESLASLEQMQARLDSRNLSLQVNEVEKTQNDELHAIINQQIGAVRQLMEWSYQYDSDKFAAKFKEMMTMPSVGDNSNYWSNLKTLVNELHDNVLVKAQEAAGGQLNESELNMLALYCCGFSRTVIMVTMGYNNIGTVYNKKLQIAKKLHVADLDEFLHRQQ
jgi:tetratricopeptide (TPR) repeat protein